MAASPLQTYILENLPLATKPWLVASLRQDKYVQQEATDLLSHDFPSENIPFLSSLQAEDWTPAALGLRNIAPSISTQWLRSNPMPDLDDEIKQKALTVANNSKIPSDDWSLEKAAWIALAIRSDIYTKESMDQVIYNWFSNPKVEYGTILACLYGMIPDPIGLFRTLLKHNLSAHNIAIVLHGLLANPLSPENLYKQLNLIISDEDNKSFLTPAAKLVVLHILQSQRPTLAQQIGNNWLDKFSKPVQIADWTSQDPLTCFHDLQEGLLQAVLRQILSLEPSAETFINTWRNSLLSPDSGDKGIANLSRLIASASAEQANHPQDALQICQQGSQHLKDLLRSIPNPLLADYRLMPLMLALSKLFLTLGQPLESEAILIEASELQPCNADILILEAQSKQILNKCDAVVNTLATALTLSPQRIDICYYLAEAMEKAGNWNDALTLRQALLDEALSSEKPDPTNEFYSLAKCALYADEAEKAELVSQHLLQINPNDGMAYYFRAQALSKSGRVSEAYECFNKAIELSFDIPLIWLGLAELHQSEGNQEEALAVLQSATQALPDNTEIYCQLGDLYLERAAYTQAQEALATANKLDPTHPRAAYLYASTLQELGHHEAAKEVLYIAHLANLDDQQITFSYAESLINVGDDEQALPYLEAIVTSGVVNQADAYVVYAEVLLAQADKMMNSAYQPEKAVWALQKALEMDPTNYRALALQAEAYAATQNYSNALETYQKLLDTPLINNSEWTNRLTLGMSRTALELGKPEVAIASLQDVIQNEPGISKPYRLLAEAYLAAQLPENALRAAQSAILLRDEDTQTITWVYPFIKKILQENKAELTKPVNSGILHQVLQDSITTVSEIIQTQPDQIDHAISLTELQKLAGDPGSARQSLIAITNSENARSFDLLRASAYLLDLQDSEAAINSIKRAIDIEINSQGTPCSSSLIRLANAYAIAGELTSAIETFDRTIQLEPTNIAHYIAKGKFLLESRQPTQALECLNFALQTNTSAQQNPEVHYLIAFVHHVDGNLPDALFHAYQALDAYKQGEYLPDSNSSHEPIQENAKIALYTLAAELSRMFLQPETSQNLLNQIRSELTSTILDQPEYITYYCLMNELNFEAVGKPDDALLPPAATPISLNSLRLVALNARMAYHRGEVDRAQEYFKSASKIISSNKSPEQSIVRSMYGQIEPIPGYLAFIEAAIDLRNWDAATQPLQIVSQMSESNPLVKLSTVRFYTLQAEYYYLCQFCDVLCHSPTPESLSEMTIRRVHDALAKIREQFINWQSQLAQLELPCESAIATRWQARADMVFEKHNLVRSAINGILSLDNNIGEHRFLFDESDVSAIISASHRLNGLDDGNLSLTKLNQILGKKNLHPALLLQIAIMLSSQDQPKALKASQEATRLLEQDRRDISAFCHYTQAKLLIEQGLFDEAKENLDVALDIWDDEPRWNSLAAQISEHLGDTQGAITHLEEAVRHEPKNGMHYLSLGRAYLNSIVGGRELDAPIYLKRAIRNFERATRLNPLNPEAWLALAKAHYQNNNLKQANQNADQALANDENNYGALSLKADIALILNNPAEACGYAKKATEQKPTKSAAYLVYARSLRDLGNPIEAIQSLDKAIPMSDNPLPLQLEKAGLIKETQGTQAAIEELKLIVNQYPDVASVYTHLSKAYAEIDQDDLAIQTAQNALAPKNGKLSELDQALMHHLLGHLLRKTGQLDQAIIHLQKATQLSPEDVESYLELGIAYKDRREYQQALQLFQQATSVAGKDPRPFFQAGLALKEGKDYRRSEVMLRKAANLAPQDVNIRRQLAVVVALNLVHNPNIMRANLE